MITVTAIFQVFFLERLK